MGLVCLDAPLIEKTWRYFSKSNYILDWARWPVNLKSTFINYAWRFEVRNLSFLFFFIDICKLLYISAIKTQMFTPLIQAYWFWKVQKFSYEWVVMFGLFCTFNTILIQTLLIPENTYYKISLFSYGLNENINACYT